MRRVFLVVFIHSSFVIHHSAFPLTPSESIQAAVTDLEALPERLRPQTRYLVLDGDDPKGLAIQAKAVAYLLNSVSRARPIALPAGLADGRMLRVDLAAYTDFKHPKSYDELYLAWDKLAERDPYFHLRTQVTDGQGVKTVTTDGGWVGLGQAGELKKLSTSFGAVLRADYFVAHVASDAYYDWAGIAAKEADFFKQFGVDPTAIGNLAADAANLFRSGVTHKPRRIIERPGAFGSVWQTKDVDAETPDRDPLRNPIDIKEQRFAFQATEFFALGANRLWRVAIYDVAGNRTDTVPDKVAKDFAPAGDGIIRPMLTCIRCHERNGGIAGLQPFHDDQTDLLQAVGLASYLPEAAQRIAELYDNAALATAMARSREDYTLAVARATGGLTPGAATDALVAIYSGYLDEQVTPARAAIELGIPADKLATAMAASHDTITLAVAAGKAVNRATWESCYADAALHAEAWRRQRTAEPLTVEESSNASDSEGL